MCMMAGATGEDKTSTSDTSGSRTNRQSSRVSPWLSPTLPTHPTSTCQYPETWPSKSQDLGLQHRVSLPD